MSGGNSKGRDTKGHFTKGHPGGPGRPRRSVERDYLATLSKVVSIEDWAQICKRAVEDAKEGNAKAREWLTRYCLGKDPQSLMELVSKEARGFSSDDEIDQKAIREEKRDGVVSQYESLLEQFELTRDDQKA